jgi:hypothetical protein
MKTFPRAFPALFLFLVAAVLLFSDKGGIGGDAEIRFRALEAMAERGELTAERYSVVQPLLATPLYYLGSTVASLRGVRPEDVAGRRETIRQFVGRFGKLVAFGISAWLFVQLRRRYGFSQGEAGAGTLFLLFGSLLIPHAVDFYSEPLWTFLSLVALGALADEVATPEADVERRWPRRTFLLVSAALAVLLAPVLAPILAATGLTASLLSRPRRPLLFFLASAGAGLGLLLVLGENVFRRGAALDFGYAGEGFTTPFIHGLLGMLAAPARGLLFFVPAALLLPLAARRQEERGRDPLLALGTVFSLLLVMAYANWHAWHGATYWGPRFLLPVSVLGALALVIVVRRSWRDSKAGTKAALASLALVSYAVYKSGAAVRMNRLLPCILARPEGDETCFWLWEHHPLAPWLDLPGLRDIVSHRSTAVEVGALLLFALLVAACLRGSFRSPAAPGAPRLSERRSPSRSVPTPRAGPPLPSPGGRATRGPR